MGKHFVVGLFLAALIGAIVVFMQRGERSARKITSDEGKDEHPRVLIEDFTLYEYKNHQATESLQGKLAKFVDPGVLEVYGDIRGSRLTSEKKEFFSAEKMKVLFASKGLTELVKDTRITSTELENQVRFGYDDIILYTDYAKYLHTQGKLLSDRPVRIQAPRADLRGSKGFEYETKNQNLKVFGPLEGTLVDERKNP